MRIYRHHLGHMLRWILITPWGGIRLHKITKSDDDRDMHDHPFDFASFLLTGSYVEHTPGGWSFRQQFSIVRKRAEDIHRIAITRPVWTLVFCGPKRREWGFRTPAGWIHWRNYHHRKGKNP